MFTGVKKAMLIFGPVYKALNQIPEPVYNSKLSFYVCAKNLYYQYHPVNLNKLANFNKTYLAVCINSTGFCYFAKPQKLTQILSKKFQFFVLKGTPTNRLAASPWTNKCKLFAIETMKTNSSLHVV